MSTIEKINSKFDISNYLLSNIDGYKEESKNILKNGNFTSSQKQDLEDIMRQYYYALCDIAKAVELLNK